MFLLKTAKMSSATRKSLECPSSQMIPPTSNLRSPGMCEYISTTTEYKFTIAAAGYEFDGGKNLSNLRSRESGKDLSGVDVRELLLLVFMVVPGPQPCLRLIDVMEVYALNGHGVFVGGRHVHNPEAQGGL